MPSVDTQLLAFGQLNLNENDVISHLCSVAVEKCQDRAERRRAGCGGPAMRRRVLIKNFVNVLMKKQAELSVDELEGEMKEEYEEIEDDDESEMNVSMCGGESEEEEDELTEDDDSLPTQVLREDYSMYGRCGSPSPPLEEDEKDSVMDKRAWDPLLTAAPSSTALHLRYPYESNGETAYKCDPYGASSSSYFLSPPPEEEENSLPSQHWADSDHGPSSASSGAVGDSSLSLSPPYAYYDDMYTPAPTTAPLPSLIHSLQFTRYDNNVPALCSVGESDAAFLALGEMRPLQEMTSFCSQDDVFQSSSSPTHSSPTECVLFDLSSPKKRRSDETFLEEDAASVDKKRVKL